MDRVEVLSILCGTQLLYRSPLVSLRLQLSDIGKSPCEIHTLSTFYVIHSRNCIRYRSYDVGDIPL